MWKQPARGIPEGGFFCWHTPSKNALIQYYNFGADVCFLAGRRFDRVTFLGLVWRIRLYEELLGITLRCRNISFAIIRFNRQYCDHYFECLYLITPGFVTKMDANY